MICSSLQRKHEELLPGLHVLAPHVFFDHDVLEDFGVVLLVEEEAVSLEPLVLYCDCFWVGFVQPFNVSREVVIWRVHLGLVKLTLCPLS